MSKIKKRQNRHLPELAFLCAGALIGAGAVVTDDVPENCVFAGVPARFVKKQIREKNLTHLPFNDTMFD